MATLADLLAETLSQAGVKVIFGLPGGENVELLDAFRQHGFEFILVRNESSAIFMADTHARISGGIGVALCTLGPGAANAYAGLAHAWLDRSPVLLITAHTDPTLVGTHTHQVLDLQAMFRPVTKFTGMLTPATTPEMLAHALPLLHSGRPGPVHLSLPAQLASQPVSVNPIKITLQSPPPLPRPLEKARAILTASKRPVIVAGHGLEPERPYAQLRALAEALQAPVIDTPKSKGALPADHPLFAGTIGLTTNDPVYELLDESDCILAIGFDVVELVKPWRQPQPLIWIANWENQDPHIDSHCEFVGEIGPILAELTSSVRMSNPAWGAIKLAAWREAHPVPHSMQADLNHQTISPADVLSAVRANTPPEIIVTTDVGSHKIFTCLHWQALRPNTFFVSNGLSVMGFGLTAAIGAAYTTREPAICITGDAGLAMMLGELSLLVELDLPVLVVVMNDSALDLIRFAQRKKQVQTFGTEFTNPDYEKIADGYGLSYARISTHMEFETAIERAIELRKPALLDVQIDPVGYR